MNREDLVNNLKLTLRNMSLEEFAHLFVNEVSAVEEFYKLCHDINSGKTISLLFNPHRLNIVTEHTINRISNPMSIYESLSDEGNEIHIEKMEKNHPHHQDAANAVKDSKPSVMFCTHKEKYLGSD